jgi:hypothetical protein
MTSKQNEVKYFMDGMALYLFRNFLLVNELNYCWSGGEAIYFSVSASNVLTLHPHFTDELIENIIRVISN